MHVSMPKDKLTRGDVVAGCSFSAEFNVIDLKIRNSPPCMPLSTMHHRGPTLINSLHPLEAATRNGMSLADRPVLDELLRRYVKNCRTTTLYVSHRLIARGKGQWHLPLFPRTKASPYTRLNLPLTNSSDFSRAMFIYPSTD